MAHWGWYWGVKKKHIAKRLCSSLANIDSFQLQKANSMKIFYIQSNSTTVVTGVEHKDHLKINIGKQAQTAYEIPIDKIPCHYGGFRPYFRCPLCNCRSRLLYFDGKSLLLCRKCLNLSYETQQLRTSRRLEYMATKAKKLIKEKGGSVKYNKKPPKMHRATYQLLRNKVYDYEGKSDRARLNEIVQWFGAEKTKWLTDGFI